MRHSYKPNEMDPLVARLYAATTASAAPQIAVAKLCGVSRTTMNLWFHGAAPRDKVRTAIKQTIVALEFAVAEKYLPCATDKVYTRIEEASAALIAMATIKDSSAAT